MRVGLQTCVLVPCFLLGVERTFTLQLERAMHRAAGRVSAVVLDVVGHEIAFNREMDRWGFSAISRVMNSATTSSRHSRK